MPSVVDVAALFNTGGAPAPITVTESPVFECAPIFSSLPGKLGSHAPTIAALPDGELLAAWYSYDGPRELDGATILAARWRPGDGWSSPQPLVDAAEPVGNPVLHAGGDTVLLFYAVVLGEGWSTTLLQVQRSIDRGQTWSGSRSIPGPLGANVRYPPVRTRDGALILPAYDDLLQRSLFFVSIDGDNWGWLAALPVDLTHSNLQPSMVELDGGRLLAVMRNGGTGWLWVAASDDGGRSWAGPVDSGFPNPASPAALLRLAGGDLLLIFNESNTVRRPLSITISADEGRTWYPPRVLADGDGEYAYPSVVQTADGLIHVVYSDNRERIQHVTLNRAWIVADE